MRTDRTGSMMMETAVAITLVALALAGVSRLLLLAGNQQRGIEARRMAQREIGNVMERVMMLPGALSPEAVKSLDLSPATREFLAEPKLDIQLSPGESGMQQIRIQLNWRDRTGSEERVELTAWKPSEAGS